MSSPYFRVIKGNFVIIGKEPDGDSVRFVADNPDLYKALRNAFRIKPSRDGSVQLRFEAVDAPELHYGSALQPLGAASRDALLGWMGFSNIQYTTQQAAGSAPVPTRVVSCDPERVPGAILTKLAEANGRPVSYVLVGDDAGGLTDGAWVHVNNAILGKTMNLRLLTEGMAYYTVYNSTPYEQLPVLREAASNARKNNLGVWAIDSTGDFVLEDQTSISPPDGQLILPKLFRRCTDYLKDVNQNGFSGNLSDWLLAHSSGSRIENDHVLINNSIEVQLSDLISQRNREIVFQPDLMDIIFIEK